MYQKLIKKTLLAVGVLSSVLSIPQAYSGYTFKVREEQTWSREVHISTTGGDRRGVNIPSRPIERRDDRLEEKRKTSRYVSTDVFQNRDFGRQNIIMERTARDVDVKVENVRLDGKLIIRTNATCDTKIVLNNVSATNGIYIKSSGCEDINIYLSKLNTNLVDVKAKSEEGSVNIYSDYYYHGLRGNILSLDSIQDEEDIQDESYVSDDEDHSDYYFGERRRYYDDNQRASGDDLLSTLRSRSGITGNNQYGVSRRKYRSGPWTVKEVYKNKRNGREKAKLKWNYDDGKTRYSGKIKVKTRN